MYVKLQLRDKYVSFEVSYGGARQKIPRFITSEFQWGRESSDKLHCTGLEIRSGTNLLKNPSYLDRQLADAFKQMSPASTTYSTGRNG